jgi:hypothetical protein
LARHSAAGELIDRLAHLGSEVIARLCALATELEPAPETLLVFGSFARGEADANSDLDVLAVRAAAATLTNGPQRCPPSPSRHATLLAVRSRCSTTTSMTCAARPDREPRWNVTSGAQFARDAIVLAGSQLDDLIDSVP